MSVETSANLHIGDGVTTDVEKTSASITIDNTISAEAAVKFDADYASAELGVSAKTGTIVEVEAGLINNNIVAAASYSDTTEVHATASGNVGIEGVGIGGLVDAYAKTGNEGSISMSVGQNGVSVGAEGSIGNCVGVDGSETIHLREASATVGAGVSIGEHLEAGGSGEATFKNGVATVGVTGEIAAIVGIDVDVSVSIDTNQIRKDSEKVANETVKVSNTVANETVKVSNTVASETVKVSNTVASETKNITKSVDNGFKKMGKGIKNLFK
jgi:hypothetical protein